jgi:hypothetical protein
VGPIPIKTETDILIYVDVTPGEKTKEQKFGAL